MKWISVKDDLPEDNFTKVLAIDISIGMESIEVVEWTECGWKSCYFNLIEPTHWCHLNDIGLPKQGRHSADSDIHCNNCHNRCFCSDDMKKESV